MEHASVYPTLYQLNTRVWLSELSRRLDRPATLDDIPDAELDQFAEVGMNYLWLLSVWQTGPASQAVSRSLPEWRREFEQVLPDLTDDDISGSGFAISAYEVASPLGGTEALQRLRGRMQERGLKLILDFVPNHVALDHPWTLSHAEYFIGGTELDLAAAPQNFVWVPTRRGKQLLARGRDPYFPPWPDVLQLNYAEPALQEAMLNELRSIAALCDGVRCDMAMLVLPEVFERTWGRASAPFWPLATEAIHGEFPGFLFLAEVYWDLEWSLQQQGFDYTYDKRLYDRLRDGQAKAVREHLQAELDYQQKLVRFLENHDEPRAAAVFPAGVHEAAAVLTYLAPGMRFFHQGQFEGRLKRVSPHLCRAPQEPVEASLEAFYDCLLSVLREPTLHYGKWQLLSCECAWEGNWTCDCFVAFAWDWDTGKRLVVAVNFAPHQSQCFVKLPWHDLSGAKWCLQDLLSSSCYHRDGDDLQQRGLYLDLQSYQYHVFHVKKPRAA